MTNEVVISFSRWYSYAAYDTGDVKEYNIINVDTVYIGTPPFIRVAVKLMFKNEKDAVEWKLKYG